MNYLRAALISLAIGIFGAWASYSYADQRVAQFEADYAAGTLFPGTADYDRFWPITSERSIKLSHIVVEENRIKARYHLALQHKGQPREHYGVIILNLKDGKIVSEEHVITAPEAAYEYDLAAMGQWADVGSTGVALASGFSEANPLGILILPGKYLMMKHSKTLPLAECIQARQGLGAVGWGAFGWNALLAGGPLAAVVGLVAAGWGSWNTVGEDAPFRCVEA